MNNCDRQYSALCREILNRGVLKENRTGISAYTIPSAYIRHDMLEGFPLLTQRKIPYQSVRVELEFFIKGLTDKSWLQERKCKYWDEWCNPKKVSYGNDPETKAKMKAETDLGKVYGYQWRNYNSSGIDQLKAIVETLKKNPNDRRMICMAWNPQDIGEMALPPCHFMFQVTTTDRLNLAFSMRSVDVILGLPSNMASYATLLHLLSLESGIEAGEICGHLNDVHIYENHAATYQSQQELAQAYPLPKIVTSNFKSIFDWQYSDTELLGYQSGPAIKYQVAV